MALSFVKSQYLNPFGVSHAFGRSTPGHEEPREYVITPEGDGTFALEVRYAGELIEETFASREVAETWALDFERHFAAGVSQAREWTLQGCTTPYARPENAFQRGWNAALVAQGEERRAQARALREAGHRHDIDDEPGVPEITPYLCPVCEYAWWNESEWATKYGKA